MKYSAGLVSKSYWYLESKKTAKYLLNGLNRDEIIELVVKDNLYQVESDYRSKRMASAIYTRLTSLPKIIIEAIINSDIATSKILVLISIMKTDRLFFEFMHEVFRNNIILGENSLKDRSINIFFQEKKIQSEIVDKWVDSTIKRLKSDYIRIISDTGILDKDSREIKPPLLDLNIKKLLLENGLTPYLNAVTGENN